MDDVILNKCSSIQRCLKRIRSAFMRETGIVFEDDYDKQDIVVLNLMRAAEQSLDLANYLIRKQQLGAPQNSKESFTLLGEAGLISKDLADQLGKMVGFRNIVLQKSSVPSLLLEMWYGTFLDKYIAVHEYQRLEMAIVKDIVNNRLVDFQRFTQQILGQQELF